VAISFISAASAAANNVNLGTFAAGDLGIVFAFRDGSTTAPTLPAGWTNWPTTPTGTATSTSGRVGYRVLQSGDTSSGTWTNATEIQVLVLRGQDAESFTGRIAWAGAVSNQPSYASLGGMGSTNGNSWVIGVGGHRSATDMNSPTVTGMTKRAPTTNTLSNHTAENVTSWSSTNFGSTVNASSGWVTAVFDVSSGQTKLFMHGGTLVAETRGTNDAGLDGANKDWRPVNLRTTRGTSGAATSTTNTVAGPTSGVEATISAGAESLEFITDPIASTVTIALPVTFNFWMSRSAAGNNMGPQGVLERVDSQGVIQSTIINSEMVTENLAPLTAMNFQTSNPTSTVMNPGDRLRLRVAYNDAGGTANAGGTETFQFGTATPDGTSDSWVLLQETITFVSEPAGSTLYPTTTAVRGGINPGSANEYEIWTSRGAGATTAVRNTVAGYTAPLQQTETGGGTALEWYTPPLHGFTLSGGVRANIRGKASAGLTGALRAELAITSWDGTSPTVWGASGTPDVEQAAETAYSIFIGGPDTNVASGQRLRFRIYSDDSYAAMPASRTLTFYYAGTSGGASGDSYITLSQAVTEYAPIASPRVIRQAIKRSSSY